MSAAPALSGLRKAALLLIQLGPEQSGPILRSLRPEEVVKACPMPGEGRLIQVMAQRACQRAWDLKNTEGTSKSDRAATGGAATAPHASAGPRD